MARWIDDIHGHEAVWQNLLDLLKRDRLPHGLAFSGPSGIGKRKVALALAQAAACATDNPPCGACPACLRVKNLQSESLFCVAPIGQGLKLEQAAEIISFLQLRSLSKRRFVIVDEASTMNASFANSLLKILEEPPPNTHFIFITQALSQLLPTIRSRVQAVRFFPLSDEILAAKSKCPPQAESTARVEPWMIQAAQGSFSQLEEWTLPEVAEMKVRAVEALAGLAQGKRGGFDSLSADIKEKESAILLVRLFQQFFRDVVYSRENLTGVIHVDAKPALDKWGTASKEDILKFWRESFQLELDIGAHLDRSLLFENFYQTVRLRRLIPPSADIVEGLHA
jgi:DNA polymerase III subunit delta'